MRSQANSYQRVLSPKYICWKHCVFVLSRIQKSDKKHLFHKSSKRDKRLLFKSDYIKSLKEHEEVDEQLQYYFHIINTFFVKKKKRKKEIQLHFKQSIIFFVSIWTKTCVKSLRWYSLREALVYTWFVSLQFVTWYLERPVWSVFSRSLGLESLRGLIVTSSWLVRDS